MTLDLDSTLVLLNLSFSKCSIWIGFPRAYHEASAGNMYSFAYEPKDTPDRLLYNFLFVSFHSIFSFSFNRRNTLE